MLTSEHFQIMRRKVRAIVDSFVTEPFRHVSGSWLVFFRILFGLVMVWFGISSLVGGYVDHFFVSPRYHFTYDGFSWVRPISWPSHGRHDFLQPVHLEFVALTCCAVGITCGLFYRFCSCVFAAVFLHVFLIDKCFYQNHYYLVAILSVLMPCLPANRRFAADCLINPRIRSSTVPQWSLWLVRFTIGLPYFFGGIAKINSDWLHGQPMGLGLLQRSLVSPIGGAWMREEWFALFISWTGLFFDLMIVPALLWRKSTRLAFSACLGFHLFNCLIWPIGIFPWLMMAATTVFFRPNWFEKALFFVSGPVRKRGCPEDVLPFHSLSIRRKAGLVFLSIFVAWQSIYPLRPFFCGQNASWDEYAHYFSWHMLLRGKETALRIFVTDPKTGSSGTVDLRRFLTWHQLRIVGRDPRLILQLCHFVADDMRDRGIENPEVRAMALVSMNGRKPQLIVDPAVDLAAERRSMAFPNWIMPLTEPLCSPPWLYPLYEWEQRLQPSLPPQIQHPNRPTTH